MSNSEGSRVQPPLRAAELTDAALIAALPDAGVTAAPRLAAEASRRRLAGAVPSLEKLCRRPTGFGANRLIPQQLAALEALADIGGEAARQVVARLVAQRIVQGPTLAAALNAAARLGSSLPPARLGEFLNDHDRACSDGRAPNDPPEIALKLVPFIVPKKLRDNVTGDLSEDFRAYAARWGRSYALYLLCWELAELCIRRFGPTAIVMGIGAWFRQKLGL
jgi:hypothetical protein